MPEEAGWRAYDDDDKQKFLEAKPTPPTRGSGARQQDGLLGVSDTGATVGDGSEGATWQGWDSYFQPYHCQPIGH